MAVAAVAMRADPFGGERELVCVTRRTRFHRAPRELVRRVAGRAGVMPTAKHRRCRDPRLVLRVILGAPRKSVGLGVVLTVAGQARPGAGIVGRLVLGRLVLVAADAGLRRDRLFAMRAVASAAGLGVGRGHHHVTAVRLRMATVALPGALGGRPGIEEVVAPRALSGVLLVDGLGPLDGCVERGLTGGVAAQTPVAIRSREVVDLDVVTLPTDHWIGAEHVSGVQRGLADVARGGTFPTDRGDRLGLRSRRLPAQTRPPPTCLRSPALSAPRALLRGGTAAIHVPATRAQSTHPLHMARSIRAASADHASLRRACGLRLRAGCSSPPSTVLRPLLLFMPPKLAGPGSNAVDNE